jgi:hypothetical protein
VQERGLAAGHSAGWAVYAQLPATSRDSMQHQNTPYDTRDGVREKRGVIGEAWGVCDEGCGRLSPEACSRPATARPKGYNLFGTLYQSDHAQTSCLISQLGARLRANCH